jgi:hypothetical protein
MLMTVSYFIWDKGRLTHRQKQMFVDKVGGIRDELIKEHGDDFFHIRKIWDYA